MFFAVMCSSPPSSTPSSKFWGGGKRSLHFITLVSILVWPPLNTPSGLLISNFLWLFLRGNSPIEKSNTSCFKHGPLGTKQAVCNSLWFPTRQLVCFQSDLWSYFISMPKFPLNFDLQFWGQLESKMQNPLSLTQSLSSLGKIHWFLSWIDIFFFTWRYKWLFSFSHFLDLHMYIGKLVYW